MRDIHIHIQKERGKEVPYSNYNANRIQALYFYPLPIFEGDVLATSNDEQRGGRREHKGDEEPLNLSSIPLIKRQQ